MSAELILKNTARFLSNHSPKILTGLAAVGVVATTVEAVRATREVSYIIADIEDADGKKMETKDLLAVTWKYYVPTASLAASTIACVLGVNAVNTKRNAVLASAYALSENTFREYKHKVIEVLGEKENDKVVKSIAKDRLEKNPPEEGTIFITGNGESLFHDALTGRYFKSSMESIRKAMNDINYEVNSNGSASQNDFYSKIGLATTTMGEELGWRFDNKMDLIFSPMITEDGQPAIMIDYRDHPVKSYYSNF